ncbi:MAG: T9SS type A sorting domain-containing protein, partial [Bacteroidales bacterium]|nr:T9SS type A sorting domain-containing protein [Bacteroidales bacterium]
SNTHSILSLYNQLIITNNGSVDMFDTDFNKTIHVYYPSEIVLSPLYAIIDKDGIIWSADRLKGLIKITGEWEGEKILLNGPFSINVFAMNISGNDLWAVPGGYKSSWAPTYLDGSIYSFIEGNWFSYYDENTPAFDSINDVVCVTINPWNHKNVFAGTWQTGLLEFNNNEIVNIYTDENSTLQRWEADPEKILVGGICFDNNGNLWVANSGANNILSVKTSEGIWKSFNLGSSASGVDISKMIIDSYNQKWILKRKTSDSKYLIYVFNDNNTISNTTDDKVKMLSGEVGEGNIPGNMVFSIAQDLDSEVWIGTDEGIAVFYSPDNIFSGGNFDAQRILVQQDGYWQYLLETETVTAITIDGSNKKWIGTDNAGVFLLSDDGTEQIHHFTEENSPLFSNSISSIVINDDGEVFFGTANGIVSFKGTATPGGVTYDDVYAYPNPVREGYTGTIAIKGLVKDADIKITDISGTLIYETKAEGGQAVWDGRNFDGRRARTGVYLVFASNEDGSETIVTKILFIN